MQSGSIRAINYILPNSPQLLPPSPWLRGEELGQNANYTCQAHFNAPYFNNVIRMVWLKPEPVFSRYR